MTSKKFRRDDEVFVIAGKDKGKKGKITKVLPDKGRAIVSGINIAKRHVKPNKKVPSGGIIPKEMPIDISNLSHIDPKSGIPTRVGFKFLEDGRKVRYAKRSGELIDKI